MEVLIADDDPIALKLLERNLRDWGYQVTAVEDGEKAWKVFQGECAPQLAILDWQMPGIDGVNLCTELKKQERSQPLYLIVLTARNEPGDSVQCLQSGADDYIAKPFDTDELKARVSVGQGILEIQAEFREKEKLQGALEMAGAVCHELNQPLQIVLGFTELLLMQTKPDDQRFSIVENIQEGVERIGRLTQKLMKLTTYKSKPYLGRSNIADIDQALEEGSLHH